MARIVASLDSLLRKEQAMKNPNLDEALHLIHQATAMQAALADQLARAANLLQNVLIHGNGVHTPTGLLHHNGDRPLIDQESLAVHWDGRTCRISAAIPLRLLERLCRRPGCFVHIDDLLHDVWDGDTKSPSTVRSAVRRLRERLQNGDMRALADAIHCECGRYGLVFNQRH
jgi:DNA-binding response OmpR family regulator